MKQRRAFLGKLSQLSAIFGAVAFAPALVNAQESAVKNPAKSANKASNNISASNTSASQSASDTATNSASQDSTKPKKALIVVDYQNDFISGALGFQKAKTLQSAILKLCKDFKGDIIFTFDTHDSNYLNTKEGQNLPILHCLKNTQGWEMPRDFAPFLKKAKRVFEKPSFGSLELAEFLRKEGYTQLEFCGLVSHICVFHNIILAFNALPNAKIVLHTNATASFDESLQTHALELLKAYWVEFQG